MDLFMDRQNIINIITGLCCFHIDEQNSIEETSGISHCGFLPSNIAVRMTGVRKYFAYKIVDRLINTHNERESFAIAIYGSWL